MLVLQNSLLNNFKMQLLLCVTPVLYPCRHCIDIKIGVSDTALCCCACFHLFSGSSSASMRFLCGPKFFMVSSPAAVPVPFSTTYRYSGNFRSPMPNMQMSRKRVLLLISARSITLRCSAYSYIFEQCLIKQNAKR